MDPKQQAESIISRKKKYYSGRGPISKNSFAIFFDSMLKKLNKRTDQGLSKKDIANFVGISPEVFRKYVNKEKVLKKRDGIIAICAMLQADCADTNDGLYYYGNMEELNEDNPRDYMLTNILDAQSEKFLSIDEINQELKKADFPELDIADHRKKKTVIVKEYPFSLVKKSVECRTDELLNDDPYNSLATAYSKFYRFYAYMWLDDNGKKYELCAEIDGFNSFIKYFKDGECYNNIEDTGIFKSCFIELKRMALAEQRRIAEMLRDTRNYIERISAKVVEDELHVFYETYNYIVPELGEYYLMDYVNGIYTLYVSNESRFMRLYLSKQEYRNMFGISSDKFVEDYSSMEMINSVVANSSPDIKAIIQLRLNAFLNAQDKINSLMNSLKSGETHICNFEMIYDNEYDVLSYYKVSDDFQCKYDTEYGEIESIGVNKALFTLSDGRQIELSVGDLCAGFRLGLSTVDEVGAFLLRHETLDITKLLENGTY